MFPARYFAPRYFAPHYFPKVGADAGPLDPGAAGYGAWEGAILHVGVLLLMVTR